MSKTKKATGQCLCGAVNITANTMSSSVGVCHCASCRTWGGGPFMTVDCGSDVTIDGTEHVSVYNSSDWAERGFCSQCGSHLYYRLKSPEQYIMAMGLFGEQSDAVFDHQVFIDEKPTFYDFANKTENMTGPEIFAKYAPPSD